MEANGLIGQFKSWQAQESAKRKAMRDRLIHLEPLREEMLRRFVTVALIVLPIEAFLVIRAGTSFKWIAGGVIWPAAALLIASACLHWSKQSTLRVGLGTGMLLQAIAFAASWNEAGLLKQTGIGYPQYGGVLMLTILLCGLLVGEFFVGVWTFICCVSLQYAIHGAAGWPVNLGWCAVYVACGWLVIQFSRHLERLHDAGRKAEEEQRSAIVAERTRFARDIHDTLAEGFTGIMMQLNAAEQRLTADPEQARTYLDKARDLANKSLEEARRSVSALRAAALGNGTLLDAIAQIGNNLVSNSSMQMETKLEGQPYSLPEECENNLLRIAQEALTNAVRHAHSSRVYVCLAYRTGSVLMEIGDTGRGMNGSESSGFGVDNMRERVRQIGGEIKILSDPGRGTRIMVTVPNA